MSGRAAASAAFMALCAFCFVALERLEQGKAECTPAWLPAAWWGLFLMKAEHLQMQQDLLRNGDGLLLASIAKGLLYTNS